MNDSLGINLAGFVRGEFGLGQAARANIRSLQAANIPLIINNIDSDWHRNLDSSHQAEDFAPDNPYPINFVNVNAEHIPELLRCMGEQYFEERYNIGFWSWELPKYPQHLRFAFDYFDEIWTPSNHSAEAITEVSPVPVIKIMHSIDFPTPSLGRETLGLPQDRFIFLFMFDFHSTFMRKNPLAVIEAFTKAFDTSDEQVLLVIKFSNADKYPPQREQLKAAASQYPSIRLIDGHFSREEVNALVYNCDCYVSLHRAEGFGLTMAEAMYYGKPVIATGYSSNTEFMNVGNSFLVRYELVDITEKEQLYEQGNYWADPDVAHAAALMYYVFHNQQQAKQVGEKAAQEIRTLLNPEVIGQKIKSRLAYIMDRKLNQF